MRGEQRPESQRELPPGGGEGQEVGAAARLAGEPSLPLELMLKDKASSLSGVYHLLELSTAPGSSTLPRQGHAGRMGAAHRQGSLWSMRGAAGLEVGGELTMTYMFSLAQGFHSSARGQPRGPPAQERVSAPTAGVT